MNDERAPAQTWWCISVLCFLSACTAATTDEYDYEADVAVSLQGLAGTGDAFWQPTSDSMITNVYYCWNNPQPNATVKAITKTSLSHEWSTYVNVDFIDEGNCNNNPPHLSHAIRLQQTIKSADVLNNGTRSRGYRMLLPSLPDMNEDGDNVRYEHCPGIPLYECLGAVVPHEFAHVLGFGHESARADRSSYCPNGNPAPHQIAPNEINTLITEYDPESVTDMPYCKAEVEPWLSPADIRGAVAIYGSGNATCTGTRPCVHIRYSSSQFALRLQRGAPAPGQANARYLQPRQDKSVRMQSFVDDWERVRIFRVSGGSNDGFVHYGDVIGIQDRWGQFVSGRDGGSVDTRPDLLALEQWVVESPSSTFANGSRVLVNGPVRLRSVRWGTRLHMTSAEEVRLTNGTVNIVWRFNGPFLTK